MAPIDPTVVTLRRGLAALLTGIACLLAPGGCADPGTRVGAPKLDPRDLIKPTLHPALTGTIGELAIVGTNQPIRVEGYGIVADLPGTGSGEMPPNIRSMMTDLLYTRGGGSPMQGTESIHPEAILSSNQIAIVEVHGVIPAMAPRGTHFDLTLTALPGTQTTSLEHGLLWTADLRIVGLVDSDMTTRTLAMARGPVYCDPQIAGPTTRPAARNLRKGRVIGGGMTLEDMSVALQLYSPSWLRTGLMQRAINARFPSREPYASARDDDVVDLRIPPEYRADPAEFIDLVVHMYLSQDVAGFANHKAMELINALHEPAAPHEELSVALQGLGRSILADYLQPNYTSADPAVRYYTARAGAAMGDVRGMIVLEGFAQDYASPFQFRAIAAMGKIGRHWDNMEVRATVALGKLLSGNNTNVRLAAYQSLLTCASPLVQSFEVKKKFIIDMVPCDGPPLVFVSQSIWPRIALIGGKFTLAPGSLYVSADNMLTVNLPADAAAAPPANAAVMPAVNAASGTVKPREPVTLYYRGPTGDKGITLTSSPKLAVILAKLGYTPDPTATDYDPQQPYIAASYQSIVEMLAGMCRDQLINARLVIGPEPPAPPSLTDLEESARPEGFVLTPAPTTAPATAPHR